MPKSDVALSIADRTPGHPEMKLQVAEDNWTLQCGGESMTLPSATAAMAAKTLLDKGLRAVSEMSM
ncbi:hypothetical protein HWC80_gp099 [Mycobacterium phage Indlulamithi]|uniref:Uncharacterized protein n=1 Tax=Mycobacterium phage Indlulamithi TaxID=2656582 RepID=A0A649VEA6_9CAUD|nr:hypothetical protein HWC80_gp099 [Mycobacterium phage Indlulamithi]QGJ90113.1 hypothetical protein PBI_INDLULAMITHI_75 [Mycobacterium phage Indlulamithi]